MDEKELNHAKVHGLWEYKTNCLKVWDRLLVRFDLFPYDNIYLHVKSLKLFFFQIFVDVNCLIASCSFSTFETDFIYLLLFTSVPRI